jgi:uncharacterized protein involved in exopolysaccharide biosynthesis
MIVQPSVRELALTFLRRKFTFLMVFGAVCLVGASYLLIKTPEYLSAAALVLRFDQQNVPDIDQTRAPPQQLGSNERREILYSDTDILRSPDLARKTIDAIGLLRIYPRMADSGQDLQHKMSAAIRAFSADMVIDVGLQSDVINISFLNPSASVAQSTIQTLLRFFYAQEASVYANPELQFTERESTLASQKLATSQSALSKFRTANKISDMTAQVNQLLDQRTKIETALAAAQGQAQRAEKEEAAYRELLTAVPPLVTTTAQGETYQAIDNVESELAKLKAKRDQMEATYRHDSPIFDSVNASIRSLESSLHQSESGAKQRYSTTPNTVYENIRTALMRATAEAQGAREPVQILTQQIAVINRRLAVLDALRTQNDDLQRNVRILDDTYRTLAIRAEEARVAANRNAQNISAAAVIAAPSLPDLPARPRRKLVALGTVLAGIIMAAAAVLSAEAFDDRLRSPHDVAQVLRLPVLATFGTEG